MGAQLLTLIANRVLVTWIFNNTGKSVFAAIVFHAADNTALGRDYADDGRMNIVCPWHGMEFDIRTGVFPGNKDMYLEGATVQVQNGDVLLVV